MFSTLVSDLVAAGMSEADIATQVGCSQASINRIKLGKQRRIGAVFADQLRVLHRERCPARYSTGDAQEVAA